MVATGTTRKSSTKTKPKTKTRKKPENLKKNKLVKVPKAGYGGARKGAGRKPGLINSDRAIQAVIREACLKYGLEEIPITVLDKNRKRQVITKVRWIAMMDKLVELGMKGNVQALTNALDRIMGKPL